MKYSIVVIFSTLLALGACNKSNSIATIPNGTYSGTFQRLNSNGGQISNVTITFNNGTWTGQSQFPKYPALCNGTYTVKNGMVDFANSCAWTAEFDWSLILSNKYQYNYSNNILMMKRENNGLFKDIYILNIQ